MIHPVKNLSKMGFDKNFGLQKKLTTVDVCQRLNVTRKLRRGCQKIEGNVRGKFTYLFAFFFKIPQKYFYCKVYKSNIVNVKHTKSKKYMSEIIKAFNDKLQSLEYDSASSGEYNEECLIKSLSMVLLPVEEDKDFFRIK